MQTFKKKEDLGAVDLTELSGKTPPSSYEAERSLLGGLVINPTQLDEVQEVGLTAADFYWDEHRVFFEAMLALSLAGKPIDGIVLADYLHTHRGMDMPQVMVAFKELWGNHWAQHNPSHYAKIIKEKSTLRKMIAVTTRIAGASFGPIENLDHFLDEAETDLHSVTDDKALNSCEDIKTVVMRTIKNILDPHADSPGVHSLKTGFIDLDELTAGLTPGQLIILAARPAMGKTSLVLSLLKNVTKSKGSDQPSEELPVAAMFSLEMAKEELAIKFLSSMAKIPVLTLKKGKFAEGEGPKLAQAASDLSSMRLYFDDTPSPSVLDIRSQCRRLRTKEGRLDLVVVDYLQLMRGTSKSLGREGSREREISEISRGLKNLAKEMRVPIIALSQLNRGVESRPNKRPMLSDLRESGAIEQDADIVCFIYRDEVYNKESDKKGIAELIVAKHRSGETKTIELKWNAQFTEFENLSYAAAQNDRSYGYSTVNYESPSVIPPYGNGSPQAGMYGPNRPDRSDRSDRFDRSDSSDDATFDVL
jgi:replicative DNA helicase